MFTKSANLPSSKGSSTSTVHRVDTSLGTHTFLKEEQIAYTSHINTVFRNDPSLQRLGYIPIPSPDQLFLYLKDGVLLCKLINTANKGIIDERVLNLPLHPSSVSTTGEVSTVSSSVSVATVPYFIQHPLNPWQIAENIQLCLLTARTGLGCKIVNVHTSDIVNQTSYLVLGILWQIIRVSLLTPVSIQYHKELTYLCEPNEELQTFIRLPPEDILLRWLNYHLRKVFAPVPPVTDFSTQLMNGDVYAYLFFSLSQTYTSPVGIEQLPSRPKDPSLLLTDDTMLKTIIDGPNVTDKVHQLLHICRNGLGLPGMFITVEDIVQGNRRLNLLFVSQIFDAFPGIVAPTTTVTSHPILTIPLLTGNPEEQRESKIFRNWLNSLELIDNDGNTMYVNNLFTDLSDGIILLKAIDHILPGTVNWKMVTTNPAKLNKYTRIENTNYAVKLGKERLNFSLLGIGGIDITDGNSKLILAYVWQLMRLSLFRLLETIQTTLRTGTTTGSTSSSLSQTKGENVVQTVVTVTPSGARSNFSSLSGTTATPRPALNDEEILRWAIDMTKQHHYIDHTVTSLKDTSLGNSLFLLDLLRCIEPNVMNPQITHTEDKEKLYENARYVISVARKLGCLIFLSPEDIVEVKSKMILTFIIAIIYRYQQKKLGTSSSSSSSSSSGSSSNVTTVSPSMGTGEEFLTDYSAPDMGKDTTRDFNNNRRLPSLPTGTSTSSTGTKNDEEKGNTVSEGKNNKYPLPSRPTASNRSIITGTSVFPSLPLPPRKDTTANDGSNKNNTKGLSTSSTISTPTGTVPMVVNQGSTPMNEATKRYLSKLQEHQQSSSSTSRITTPSTGSSGSSRTTNK